MFGIHGLSEQEKALVVDASRDHLFARGSKENGVLVLGRITT